VVVAQMGPMDPRAYVRLAAMLRQQIADGHCYPVGELPRSPTSAKSMDTHGLPVARRCACWKVKAC
jgi:hypothetical protein